MRTIEKPPIPEIDQLEKLRYVTDYYYKPGTNGATHRCSIIGYHEPFDKWNSVVHGILIRFAKVLESMFENNENPGIRRNIFLLQHAARFGGEMSSDLLSESIEKLLGQRFLRTLPLFTKLSSTAFLAVFLAVTALFKIYQHSQKKKEREKKIAKMQVEELDVRGLSHLLQGKNLWRIVDKIYQLFERYGVSNIFTLKDVENKLSPEEEDHMQSALYQHCSTYCDIELLLTEAQGMVSHLDPEDRKNIDNAMESFRNFSNNKHKDENRKQAIESKNLVFEILIRRVIHNFTVAQKISEKGKMKLGDFETKMLVLSELLTPEKRFFKGPITDLIEMFFNDFLVERHDRGTSTAVALGIPLPKDISKTLFAEFLVTIIAKQRERLEEAGYLKPNESLLKTENLDLLDGQTRLAEAMVNGSFPIPTNSEMVRNLIIFGFPREKVERRLQLEVQEGRCFLVNSGENIPEFVETIEENVQQEKEMLAKFLTELGYYHPSISQSLDKFGLSSEQITSFLKKIGRVNDQFINLLLYMMETGKAVALKSSFNRFCKGGRIRQTKKAKAKASVEHILSGFPDQDMNEFKKDIMRYGKRHNNEAIGPLTFYMHNRDLSNLMERYALVNPATAEKIVLAIEHRWGIPVSTHNFEKKQAKVVEKISALYYALPLPEEIKNEDKYSSLFREILLNQMAVKDEDIEGMIDSILKDIPRYTHGTSHAATAFNNAYTLENDGTHEEKKETPEQIKKIITLLKNRKIDNLQTMLAKLEAESESLLSGILLCAFSYPEEAERYLKQISDRPQVEMIEVSYNEDSKGSTDNLPTDIIHISLIVHDRMNAVFLGEKTKERILRALEKVYKKSNDMYVNNLKLEDLESGRSRIEAEIVVPRTLKGEKDGEIQKWMESIAYAIQKYPISPAAFDYRNS